MFIDVEDTNTEGLKDCIKNCITSYDLILVDLHAMLTKCSLKSGYTLHHNQMSETGQGLLNEGKRG